MKEKTGVNRRQFLVSTSAAAIGVAGLQGKDLQAEIAPQAFQSAAGSSIPYSRQDLVRASGPQRSYTSEQAGEVAFPLGGIGTGTVSLGGRGQLADWEIFNGPAKGTNLPMASVALRVQAVGATPVTRVVERRLLPPYDGQGGNGRGLKAWNRSMPGAARFRE